MDYQLFAALSQNILGVRVSSCPGDALDFRAFEESCCYDAMIQPMFTQSYLMELGQRAEEAVFYEIQDSFGIWLLLLRLEGRVYLIGPYVKRAFELAVVQRALIHRRLPAAYLTPLQLYYASFPITSTTQVRDTVAACAGTLAGRRIEFASSRVVEQLSMPDGKEAFHSKGMDYNAIYQTYDWENRFLHMIENGDSEHVLAAFMSKKPNAAQVRHGSAEFYQNPIIGFSMVRALARKAAERGGASVLEIDEITQRTAQKMFSAKSTSALFQYTLDMLLELTDAVRRSRYQSKRHSRPIGQIVEYLQLNYSQSVSLDDLSAMSGLSNSQLSKRFKAEVGMPVFQFISRMRCTRAAELLSTTDVPVQEISAYVGYPDSNYFVKVFRKQYGVTPSDYRKQSKPEFR